MNPAEISTALAENIRRHGAAATMQRALMHFARANAMRRQADHLDALESSRARGRAAQAREHLLLAALFEDAARELERGTQITPAGLAATYVRYRDQYEADPGYFAVLLQRRLHRQTGLTPG